VLAYAFLYKRQHDYALQEYQRAVELNPNYADLMSDMTFVLALMGRAHEGLDYMEKAKRFNPNYPDWYLWNFALAYYTLHRYSDAIANLKAADLPTRYRLHLAASYAQLGRLDEAHAEVRKILESDPGATIRSWSQHEPYQYQADLDHYIDGLRKAGLPE